MDNKWKALLDKIKDKKVLPKKNQLLILMLIGILLLVIAIPTPDKQDNQQNDNLDNASGQMDNSYQNSSEEYEEYLENRVSNALEYVEGVGKAEVLITLKSSGQKIIEKDQQNSSQKTEEEDSTGGTRSIQDSTSDKTSIYEQGSDGSQSPYVSKELTPEISGVVVIADGGDNAVVVQNITEAIQALFGVEAHKIKIMKRTDT